MPSSGGKTCARSEEHTSELQSHDNLVCRLLLEKKNIRCRHRGADAILARDSVDRPRRALLSARAMRSTVAGPGSGDGPPTSTAFFFFIDAATTESYPLPPPAPLRI